ncbi:MAG TPA: 16S rRNA (cytosine(1402)-N(4))-methyltransferase RsmH [Candidatus Hydrogenedentes bacterium]|nr:16S rRNA (cytosine(1402)-N(4))-methyltransferase RsmH [Candidatus Hydrogenedentota bacterium]HOS02135.1 16S rRNA (cytosine(1402)-N(4))-methyltransferase RsmH [Candidatus Hydrogenedentota bacterium]
MHVPVLADAVLDWLNVQPGGTYVDCTVGAGGHASLIAARLTQGRLIGLDRDPSAIALAREQLRHYPFVTLLHRNYGDLRRVLAELDIVQVDGILIDAGVSSMQIDDPARGFSFQATGPLDMRMDSTGQTSAADYLARVSEEELTRTLRTYGDIGPARRIAAAIVRRRLKGTLQTTHDLGEAVGEGLGLVRRRPEEVRTVFQAIRIAVNEEYRWLEEGLEQAIDALAPGGRIVAIAFHSGEDRIVKNRFRAAARPVREYAPDGRLQRERPARLRVLTPKPVMPDKDETRANPRAHSAKLRAAERTA